MKFLTDEEKQQVQNLINARTKLLTEKSAKQDEEIKTLSSTIITLTNTLEARENEIENLSEKLSHLQEELDRANEQNQKLTALIQSEQPLSQPAKIPEAPQKPNYLLSLLRQHFGLSSFRPGQEEIIDALLSGRDVFCSMPENYGKSICYRLPALLMPGVTLAVTPDDPPDSLITPHSEILTPSLTPSKRREILRKVRNGTAKILYATIQQLSESDSLSALKKAEISMTAIISRWGNPQSLEKWPELLSSVSNGKITAGVFADSTSPALRQELLRLSDLIHR